MSKASSMPDFDTFSPEQWEKMGITKEQFLRHRKQSEEREKKAPPVGSAAPDFEIKRVSADGKLTEERVRLSDFRGRPVALIFGSYTWPPFRDQAGRLNGIYKRYLEKVAFLCIYIKEAHPEDEWQAPSNVEKGILFKQPKTEEERAKAAESCVLGLNLEMPMGMDDMDDSVDNAYIALPDRLYVIDSKGKITYRSGPGPFGFDVDAWENALAKITQ